MCQFTGYAPHTKIIVGNLATELTRYPNQDIKSQLLNGFMYGFPIGLQKLPKYQDPPLNHPPFYEKAEVVKQMVSDEVELECILGPYNTCPLEGLICSPLNLVPNVSNPGKYQLIHNLAFPYSENSVNANIPDCEAKVEYQKFDVAIKLGLKHGQTAHASKVDFDEAFRNFLVILKDLLAPGVHLGRKILHQHVHGFWSQIKLQNFRGSLHAWSNGY